MTNYTNTVLYTGSTGKSLKERIWEHKQKLVEGFTKRYNINKLIYYEVYSDLESALNREKQIKAGSRNDKVKLIESLNKDWKDLYEDLD